MKKDELYKNSSNIQDTKIYSMFREHANNIGNESAIIFNDNQSMSYLKLNEKILNIATKLNESGVDKGNIVAFMVKRSPTMIATIFSIFSLDCAYLPMDLDLPDDRISYMLENSGAKFLITEKDIKINKEFEAEIELPCDLKLIKFKNDDAENCDYSELAYVIYTSGSTGKPKGVMVKESAVINFIHGMDEIIEFKKCKNILASTTATFDISVLELILPLTLGLTVILADEVQQKDPNLLLNLITENAVDLIQFTPSRTATLLVSETNYAKLKNLKYVLIGGEKFSDSLFKKLRSVISNNTKILNMYGPTETTIWSSYKDLTNESYVSVGQPIKNTRIYAIDDKGKIINEEKSAGEICIAGDGLALGYIKNKELTDKRFIFQSEANEYVYKTGDFGLWNKGNLECMGRIDFQIKINGYRVELEEIESVLSSYQDIREAVVVVNETSSNVFLKAYVTVNKKINAEEVQEYLKGKLPLYMVPSIIEEIDVIPLMINGKADRNKLKQISESTTDLKTPIKFENEIQKEIAEIWSKILGIKSIDINKNFFDYGGNSLSIAMVASLINEKFKINIGVLDLFEHTTVAQISSFIENKDKLATNTKTPTRLNIKKLKNLKK